MPIYWTDSVNTEINKMTLTKSDEERILTAARIHKQTIESDLRHWAEVRVNKEYFNSKVITSIWVEKGVIHSDGSKETKIMTYRYYIENNIIRYSEIFHP